MPSSPLQTNSLTMNTLLTHLYKPNSTIHISTHYTLHSQNIWYQSQVKPSHKPLEVGICVTTSCRGPHYSVVPTTGTHLPEEGRWKKNINFIVFVNRCQYEIKFWKLIFPSLKNTFALYWLQTFSPKHKTLKTSKEFGTLITICSSTLAYFSGKPT